MLAMTFRDIFVSPDFHHDLQEMSSYLASVTQERPIVLLLAKNLWKRGHPFVLEAARRDLVVDAKPVEVSFHYDTCQLRLKREMAVCRGDFKTVPDLVAAKKLNRKWGILPKLCEDMFGKNPAIFIWILCSRDLNGLPEEALRRVNMPAEQKEFNQNTPYGPSDSRLAFADSILDKLQAIKPFALTKVSVPTEGLFPSTYHFRICDFSPNLGG